MKALGGNPVLYREVTSILRTPKAFVLMSLLVLALTALLALRWPADGMADREGTRARTVFQLIGCGLSAGMLLMAPAFPSTSIATERQRGTLPLLFNSPLTPLQIYFGKLVGSLTYMAIVLLATLPAAAACYAMGGVSLKSHILPLYALLALAAFHYTAMSLLVSARASSADSALRTSYGLVFVLTVAVLAPSYFTRGKPGLASWISERLYHLSPLPALMSVMGLRMPSADGLRLTAVDELFWLHLSTAGAVALLWVGAGVWQLRPSMLDRSRDSGVMTDDRSLGGRFGRRVLFLFFFDPQRRSRGVSRLINPLLVKELRTRRFGRTHWMMRLVAVCAMISIALTYAAMVGVVDRGMTTVGTILVTLQVVLVVLLTPSLAAGLISGERESGGWQLLQMTPLTARRIVSGKLLSVIITLGLILLATLPGYVVMLYVGREMLPQVVRVVASLALASLFCLLLGAAVGSFFRRSAPATACAYALLLLLFGGTMLIWLGRDAPFGYDVVRGALLLNPAAGALSVIGAGDFQQYDLLPYSWYWTAGLSLLFFVALVVQSWRLSKPE